jgi:hypothetical protein
MLQSCNGGKIFLRTPAIPWMLESGAPAARVSIGIHDGVFSEYFICNRKK